MSVGYFQSPASPCSAPLRPRVPACPASAGPVAPPPTGHPRAHARLRPLRTPLRTRETRSLRSETVGTVPPPPAHVGDARRAPPDRVPSADTGGTRTARPRLTPASAHRPPALAGHALRAPDAWDRRRRLDGARVGHLRGASPACASGSRWDRHQTVPRRDGPAWATATGSACEAVLREHAGPRPSCSALRTPVA